MKSKVITYCVIGLVVIGGLLYFNNISSSVKPRVLGLSINTFYSNKNFDVDKIPEKKDGVEDPIVLSDSAVLIEEGTKYPLYSKNDREPVAIASITKVMTYLVARENYDFEDIVTVGENLPRVIGSMIVVQEGEQISVESLIYGLLVNSGNDAAHALAYKSGSIEEFVKLMNDKAFQLGMNDTHFVDPAGLDDNGRSSAFDVAILFSHALSDEMFVKFVGTSEKEVSSTDGQIVHNLRNSNRLVTGDIPMDGVVGGKTGFTLDAGHTLVCAAERDGARLISVILKTHVNTKTASAYQSRNLLNWGFDSFSFY